MDNEKINLEYNPLSTQPQNKKILSPEELLTILHKSAALYSDYADTTLLFIFREKKFDKYDYYEVKFGKEKIFSKLVWKELSLEKIVIREKVPLLCIPRYP